MADNNDVIQDLSREIRALPEEARIYQRLGLTNLNFPKKFHSCPVSAA